ncbi:hypothetical protein [Saccharopolyspora hattusasensis]|uniref:hypothetical protein n=1 Tax=Saccharopolyspora hattusasensis TaxID=1128679 RepID=UPI003D982A80
MSDDQSIEDPPTGSWAAFGYQNHILLNRFVPRDHGKLTALCGVLTPPAEVSEKDDRPVCAWCAEQVQTGQVRVELPPDTA